MKRLGVFLVTIIIFTVTYVSAEMGGSYMVQGRIKDYGQSFTGSKVMNFKLYTQSVGGSAVWESGVMSVSISSGMFEKEVTPSVKWSTGDYWMETVIDETAAVPRQIITPQILSLHSKTSEGIERSSTGIPFVIGTSTPMYITTTGRLGIGTTNPSQTLDVLGDMGIRAATTNALIVENTVNTAGYGGLNIKTANTAASTLPLYIDAGGSRILTVQADGSVGISSSTPQGKFVVGAGAQPYLIVASGGNVGIGTSNPARKLDVVGDMNVSGMIYGRAINAGTIITSAGGQLSSGTTYRSSNIGASSGLIYVYVNHANTAVNVQLYMFASAWFEGNLGLISNLTNNGSGGLISSVSVYHPVHGENYIDVVLSYAVNGSMSVTLFPF